MNNQNNTQTDFRIDENGRWFHDGAPIERKALAKLFSDRALKLDAEGRYWLQTPFEKYPVQVADVPYLIVDYDVVDGGVDVITNMDECIEIGVNHPVELRSYQGNDLPYVHIRDGLYARFGRNVYYALINAYGAELPSRGQMFSLGTLDHGTAEQGAQV